jgi:hypothetical protein
VPDVGKVKKFVLNNIGLMSQQKLNCLGRDTLCMLLHSTHTRYVVVVSPIGQSQN